MWKRERGAGRGGRMGMNAWGPFDLSFFIQGLGREGGSSSSGLSIGASLESDWSGYKREREKVRVEGRKAVWTRNSVCGGGEKERYTGDIHTPYILSF